ncbi:flavodoxin family protein [Brachymonas denitrificans]|jgi:multimeric flavodoxin WrbA|uniref:Flavoprotein WrbA n=1 Tax=Brachymonas denitrificans DSM 15123 TaxID=1121117 RepID=A0A1H8GYZ5_9BURK|nr:flavodoxin family protein [Brachymonas denitrificans]SEN49196.1 Multimeric flavodoxin WrbA [Brachymonas denitrificans DSM 15123]
MNHPNVVVVYHSGYGHTQRMAHAVADGAQARVITIDADGNLPPPAWEELNQADAIIFGAPTYMGGPSWQFKKFADATSKQWFAGVWKDKLFGGFTNSATMNGDKGETIGYFMTLAAQHGGLWVSLGIMPSNSKAAGRNDPNYVGGYAGALATTPSDAGVGEMAQGDLDTARQYGERVLAAAVRWKQA